jgi:hypothetical protein
MSEDGLVCLALAPRSKPKTLKIKCAKELADCLNGVGIKATYNSRGTEKPFINASSSVNEAGRTVITLAPHYCTLIDVKTPNDIPLSFDIASEPNQSALVLILEGAKLEYRFTYCP